MSKTGGSSVRSWAVIGVVIVAVVVALGAVMAYGTQTASDMAVVHKSDGTVEEFPLDTDGVYEVVTDKGTNVVQVQGGAVRVMEADCPNGDCVNQGFIDRAGQQIVCLPHELWVEVVPADARANEGAGEEDGIVSGNERADSSAVDDEMTDTGAHADPSNEFDTVGS